MYNIYIMIDLILMAGVPHLNLSDFVFLLIYYFQVLSSSANKRQQNLNASCNLYSTKYDCFFSRSMAFTFDLCDLLSVNLNPFAPGDFAEKRILKLVKWFSGHCSTIKSQNLPQTGLQGVHLAAF